MKKTLLCAAATFALIAPQMASAAPVLVNQWYNFTFAGVGSSLAAGGLAGVGTNPASILAPDAPWTFTLGSAGTLTLLDGFNSGDQFSLADFGTGIGSTSAPIAGQDCGSDITACLGNAAISKGTFALGAGNHSISGTTLLSPFGGGAGFFRVTERVGAVPEPATWALMLLGFGFIGFSMRSRRKQNVTVSYA